MLTAEFEVDLLSWNFLIILRPTCEDTQSSEKGLEPMFSRVRIRSPANFTVMFDMSELHEVFNPPKVA